MNEVYKYKRPKKCWSCHSTWLRFKDKDNRKYVCNMCGVKQ